MHGDRINPIVIKELRQGLKSRSFLLSFVGLQVAMIMSMFIYITSAVSPRGDLDGADVFFWAMLNILFLLLMPLRAFQALYEEINGKTLELLFLTRMTSWNISLGKWVALVLQALLMISAILPYFVLRYFLGSIDITLDLYMLGGILLSSMVLISIGVGLSCITSKLLRVLIFLGGAFGLWTMGVGVFAVFQIGGMIAGGRSSGPTYPTMGELLPFLIGSLLAILFFIEFGASRIAPPAENHSRWKRLIGFAILLLFIGVTGMGGDSEVMFVSLFVIVPLMVGALCEPLHRIPGAYKSRFELPVLNWFLLPGWPSGFLYSVLMMATLSLSMMLFEGFDDEMVLFCCILTNILFAPYLLIRCMKWLQIKALLSYLAFQLLSLLFSVMFMVLNEIGLNPDGFTQILGLFLPFLGLMQLESYSDPFQLIYGVITFILLAFSGILTLPGLEETTWMRNLNPNVSDNEH